MTAPQRRVLKLLAEGALPETALTVERVQRRVLAALAEAGLAQFQPYAREPSWRITAAGRAALNA